MIASADLIVHLGVPLERCANLPPQPSLIALSGQQARTT